MSKSAGEFLTVSLLEEKGYDPLVYRLFCLQSHYRKSLLFSYENLDNAAAAYLKLVERVAALLPDAKGEIDTEAFESLRGRFDEALGDDLNTSMAITVLYDVLKAQTNAATKLALFECFEQVLSLGLVEAAKRLAEEQAASPAVSAEEEARINALLEKRAQAKKAKNFAEADAIRDQLKAEGILIVDTPQGAVWKRA